MKKFKKVLTNRLFWIIIIIISSAPIILYNPLLFRKIQFHWSLGRLKSKADKIVITYNSKFSAFKPVSFSLNKQGRESFWKCIEVKLPKPGSIRCCACWGNPILQFYSRGKLIDSFTIHHGKTIRWKKFKWGDIPITPTGQKRLKELFAKYGIRNTKELRSQYSSFTN